MIGGGYVGLELSQAMRRFGSRVTIIDRNNRLMHREDDDVTESLQNLFEDEGIDTVLNARVKRITGKSGQSVKVVIEQRGAEKTLEGSHLLVGLSEKEAKAQGIAYRLFKIPMEAVMRASTMSETRGFLKALVEADGDRILGFTGFGVDTGEILSSVQIAMVAGLPYTALRDAILTHPTLVEGLIPLFLSVPSVPKSASKNN